MYKPQSNEKKTIGIKQVNIIKKSKSAQRDEIAAEKDRAWQELGQAKDELEQVKKEQETLLLNTKRAIEQEKENWKEEKKNLRKAARQEGYQTGYIQGKEESLREFSSLIDQANSLTDAALQDYEKTIEKSEEKILDLAIHTAGRIMTLKLEEDPSAFLPIVKAAVKELKDQTIITIHVHPDYYLTVMEQKDELVRLLEDDMKLSLYANENLDETGCMIHHPFGQIDAGVDTQLEQIRKALSEIAMENRS
ncbi:flagellar assembly protein FliH [Virgibacillus kimchii]